MPEGRPVKTRRAVRFVIAPPTVRQPLVRGLVRLRRVKRRVAQAQIPDRVLDATVRRSRAATVEGLSPEAALYASRNFRLGVLNGVVFGLLDGILSPSIVLAVFVNRLGGSNFL